MPTDRCTIRRFVSYLDTQGLSGATASVYVAGVRSHQLEEGFEDPCKGDVYLNMMLKGYTNKTKPIVPKRKPLTMSKLDQLRIELFNSPLNFYDKCLLWSAFTTAFYGMLRVSEYTSLHQHKFTRTTLLRSDVEFNERGIRISLKRDKTHQRTAPPPIILLPVKTKCCPVKAMREFLSLRAHATNIPMFVFKEGQFLTRQRVNKELHVLLGPDYTSHSFRIGAASAASKAGCSNEQIRVMGRWRSNVANRYVRPDYIEMGRAMTKMSG